MKELTNEIISLFKYFNGGDYLFFIIFILSTVYIFITEKEKKIKDFFVGYTIVILFIIWNPICVFVYKKMINYAAMYRLYYMLPTCITIAYTGTKISEKYKNTILKVIVVFVMVIFIVFSGNSIFNSSTTAKYANFYKLPDESVEVAYIINADKKHEFKKAIVPYDGTSAHIRQIIPTIQMFYTRIVSSPKDENGNHLPYDSDYAGDYPPVYNLNAGNVEYIVELCKTNGINYVVFNRATILSDKMEHYGFELCGKTKSYIIYRSVN